MLASLEEQNANHKSEKQQLESLYQEAYNALVENEEIVKEIKADLEYKQVSVEEMKRSNEQLQEQLAEENHENSRIREEMEKLQQVSQIDPNETTISRFKKVSYFLAMIIDQKRKKCLI